MRQAVGVRIWATSSNQAPQKCTPGEEMAELELKLVLRLVAERGLNLRRLLVVTFTEAAAATAVGIVEEIGPDDRAVFEEVFLAKHPHLERFVRSPSCVPLGLQVSTYMVVTRFQHVIELHFD